MPPRVRSLTVLQKRPRMKCLLFWALCLALTMAAGCKKSEPVATAKADNAANGAQAEPGASSSDAQPPTRGPGTVTASHAPVVISENANTSAILSQLSLELRRYVLRSQKAPKTFEEFLTASQVQAPAAPPGKKYAIEKGAVVLVNR